VDGYILYPDDNGSMFQEIKIIEGPFAGFKGAIHFIDREKMIVRVMIDFWGRDTPVELSFSQIRPLD
jgi:transcriptional antiterminator NusG